MRVTALKEVTYDPSIFMDIATVDDAVRGWHDIGASVEG